MTCACHQACTSSLMQTRQLEWAAVQAPSAQACANQRKILAGKQAESRKQAAGNAKRGFLATSKGKVGACITANMVCFLHTAWTKRVRKKEGAAASVARSLRERLARAGRGMRASQSDTRAASQAFERTHTHTCIQRKHRVLAAPQQHNVKQKQKHRCYQKLFTFSRDKACMHTA